MSPRRIQQENSEKGREAAAPSFIKEIQEVQRGQEAPHDGGAIIPKDAQVTPFHPKGLINPSLNIRFPSGPKGVDGLPSGHPNLNGSHLGLLKDFPRGILVIEMLPTSLRPKEIEDEAMKDVKRLSYVGEAPYMVPLDPERVVFSLEDGFT